MKVVLQHPSGARAELFEEIAGGWTLETIFVPERLRGTRIGVTLLLDVIIWMKRNGVRRVDFIPMNNGFWQAAKARFPNQIDLPNYGNGHIRT